MRILIEIRGHNANSVLDCLKEVAKYNNIELVDDKTLSKEALEIFSYNDVMNKPLEFNYKGNYTTLDQKKYQDFSDKYNCAIQVYYKDLDTIHLFVKGKMKTGNDYMMIHDLEDKEW